MAAYKKDYIESGREVSNYYQNIGTGIRNIGPQIRSTEARPSLTYFPRFARTPLPLAKFMCSLFGINDESMANDEFRAGNRLKCVDLMAGNGNIARFISKKHSILAVERKEMRYFIHNMNMNSVDKYLLKVFIIQPPPKTLSPSSFFE